ncbi:hypothetical protein M409DRAFT_26913 [Zasmidium cellare ATCC 36951]|uniref:NAD(P)-binding protein n=1 Tax=Zasmidium cellare ATCC 36951 TaxID=1080233 RepID=A0A6A6CB42_ZASCE|nr:uncharacterized protein M409DRAFT_26913 [Zasmidium cellare ATCC 36951]KAF2162676.1 hypothetical protein M409DRAFT_26913 [Zasmidium cellare ATCC 36951]
MTPPKLTPTTTSHTDTYPFISPLSLKEPPNLSVLITGASKGIGLATAISFAQAGFPRIAIFARSDLSSAETKIKTAAQAAGRTEPQVVKLQGSIADKKDVAKAFSTLSTAFDGKLDILINNASRLETWKPLHEIDAEDWWATWELNLKGTFLVTQAAIPLLLNSVQKTVVTVTSAGAFVTMPGASAYQGSKTAQVRLTEFLGVEYGEQGLLAYTIHPCGAKTETALNMPENMHFMLTETPELAADTLVWLTRERREWLQGRFVFGPGDMEELEGMKEEIVQRDLMKLKLDV